MRILVPVDGSIPSRSVLQFVSDRAKQMPVMPVVQLLTVEPPVPSSGIGTMMELEAVRSAFAAEGERVLQTDTTSYGIISGAAIEGLDLNHAAEEFDEKAGDYLSL